MLLKHGIIKGARTMSQRCIKSEAGKNLGMNFCSVTKQKNASRVVFLVGLRKIKQN